MAKNVGKIVQVVGTVIDVEFESDKMPKLLNALELDNQGEKLTLEVEQHVGNRWARCLALCFWPLRTTKSCFFCFLHCNGIFLFL